LKLVILLELVLLIGSVVVVVVIWSSEINWV